MERFVDGCPASWWGGVRGGVKPRGEGLIETRERAAGVGNLFVFPQPIPPPPSPPRKGEGSRAAVTPCDKHDAASCAGRLGRTVAAEVGGGGVLAGLDDAATGGARLHEQLVQRVAVAEADGALQRGEVLAEAAEHLQHRLLVVEEDVAPHD